MGRGDENACEGKGNEYPYPLTYFFLPVYIFSNVDDCVPPKQESLADYLVITAQDIKRCNLPSQLILSIHDNATFPIVPRGLLGKYMVVQ